MENDRADEFLDMYRTLEEALNQKYNYDEKTFGSSIVRFINDKESKEYRDKLNICREIRNLLSHHSEVDGERIVQPSEALINFLHRVTEYVTQPPKALECATLYSEILKTSPSQKVQTVMKKMERQGFSHVPVIKDGQCIGVFSTSTIFQYSLNHGLSSMNENMLISDFGEYLPVDKHSGERFRFLGKDATINDVRVEFDRHVQRSRRLAVVFITDNGSSQGKILGMITPLDLINY